jgi:hypothetical protein
MRGLLGVCILGVAFAQLVAAQTAEVTAKPLSDTDVQLMRSDLQSEKNKVIADNMKFTDAESTAFWPVYRDYAHDQHAIGDELGALIKDYAQHADNMNDSTSKELAQRMLDIEEKNISLRRDYWPKFEKALGAKRAARFYQVDNRLSLMMDVQLASQIPLIP